MKRNSDIQKDAKDIEIEEAQRLLEESDELRILQDPEIAMIFGGAEVI
jgi:hypothetical protein